GGQSSRTKDMKALIGNQFSVAGAGLILALATIVLSSNLAAQSKAPTPNPVAAEITAVKRVIAARREYQTSLEALRTTYAANSDPEKLRWAEDELKQFHHVPKPAYVLDLDVPGPGLRAEQNIPAANDLYRRAMEYKGRGFGSDQLDNQIRS